jgi:cysteine synthase A
LSTVEKYGSVHRIEPFFFSFFSPRKEFLMIYHGISDLIGHTPLLSPDRLIAHHAIAARLLCKLEGQNPAGSAKDRIALAMICSAEEEGKLRERSTVIEPTSGNTGIGLAAVAASRGYRVILTMPDTMSRERIALLEAYGAEVVLTPGKDGMRGAIDRAEKLAREIPNAWIPAQFDNEENPRSHYETTGPEIWEDAEGRVDLFVAGVGTGGTLCGSARYLKEKNPSCRVIAVEPASSPLLSKGYSGAHGLQGIGANFVPQNFDRSVCDEIVTVTEEEAFVAARELAALEGLLVGISSGAALHAATLLAKKPENAGKTVVVILPDSGERYLSTGLFAKK